MPGHDQVTSELLLRAQRGDVAALGQLLDAQRAELHRLADRLVDKRIRGRVDASDLVQQTCLSAHKKIADFQGAEPAQFVAWLRQVHENNIRNAVRDHLHAGRRAAGLERPGGPVEAAADSAETPSQRLVQSETEATLEQALERLPDDERTVLRLRYLEGRTVSEIADAMGLSRDALIWVIKRALRRVRTHLPDDLE